MPLVTGMRPEIAGTKFLVHILYLLVTVVEEIFCKIILALRKRCFGTEYKSQNYCQSHPHRHIRVLQRKCSLVFLPRCRDRGKQKDRESGPGLIAARRTQKFNESIYASQ